MLTFTLRVLGVTLIDLTVNTDAEQPETRDLDSGYAMTAGFQSTGLVLPSTDTE